MSFPKKSTFLVSALLLVARTSVFAAEFDVQLTSDKELYYVGETASFTVTVYKNGDLLTGDDSIVEATFPDEQSAVVLNAVSPGVFSYESELTSAEQMTLTAILRHDFSGAIEAMEAKIVRLEAEVADLEAQLAEETDAKEQRKLEAKIDNRLAMIDKFEEKIANFEEPEAIDMKTITVEETVTPYWMNVNGRTSYNERAFGVTTTLGDAKLSVLPDVYIPVEDAGLYSVSTSSCGAALDETRTFEDLGLTEDGVQLFLCQTL